MPGYYFTLALIACNGWFFYTALHFLFLSRALFMQHYFFDQRFFSVAYFLAF